MNGLAAPDVRAPSVRGRWHLGPLLARFPPPSSVPPPWLPPRLRIYAGSMNDAVKPGPENPSQATGMPQLSVVVPTFNERDNVTVLYRRLDATLKDISWEVVFVDDNSPDGTWEVVRGLAQQDSRVRCIRRSRPDRPMHRGLRFRRASRRRRSRAPGSSRSNPNRPNRNLLRNCAARPTDQTPLLRCLAARPAPLAAGETGCADTATQSPSARSTRARRRRGRPRSLRS